ncbi:MAG: toll/interleukin-1 receptor domain-containing protein [Chloroflexi bacterium]|nr:toll/interleukin-1 receptor domain-containing protein [Chloroflexota bacterium]
MYMVFVSYKTGELSLLDPLVTALRQASIDVYIAEENPQPGRHLYDQKIIPGIKASDCMLVLLTPAAAKSQDVISEIGMALSLSKPIVVLLERGVQCPGPLAGKEVLDFDRQDSLSALQKACDCICDLAGGKEQTEAEIRRALW